MVLFAGSSSKTSEDDSKKKSADSKTTGGQGTKPLFSRVATDGKDDATSNVVSLEDAKKKAGGITSKTAAVFSGGKKGQSAQEDGIPRYLVTHGGLTVDAFNHYGGAFVEDCMKSYKIDADNDISFLDISNMTYEERFRFFVDNPEVAFNMWQDLCENITIQDDEYYEGYDDNVAMYSDEELADFFSDNFQPPAKKDMH